MDLFRRRTVLAPAGTVGALLVAHAAPSVRPAIRYPARIYSLCAQLRSVPRAVARYGAGWRYPPVSVSGAPAWEQVQPPTINCSVSALRFFFTVTLDRPDLSRRLVLARYPRKLPEVLSVEEVGRLLEAAPGIKLAGCEFQAPQKCLRLIKVYAINFIP
jgi:hypothetical protein